jgi:hypothetical protein
VSEFVTLWRDAMQDEKHPRYVAAWALFSPKTSGKAAAKLLQEQSVEVIPWLLQIIDAEELRQPSSLGKGKAPVKAVEMLGIWQVTDALPQLMTIIETYTFREDLFDTTINALQAMGPVALDAILELFQRVEHEKKIDLTAPLSVLASGDANVYAAIQRVFEQETTDDMKLFVAMSLMTMDAERTKDYLRRAARKANFGPRMKRYLKDHGV